MGPKLALFICIVLSVLASSLAAKCRIRAGDFYISANTSLPNLSSEGSYLAFSGGPAMGAPDDGIREPHYFLSSIDSNNKMNFKYVVRACERQTDQFDILWDKDCLGFSLTLSSTGGDHCAPGFAGSYRAIDYCQRACKLRAGLLLQREDGVTTIVGARSKVVKGDSVFPVITSDPSKGSSWAEWTETLTAELLQLQTIAEVNLHGLVITEKDNRLCTSRGAYDLEFRDYCTTARIQPTKTYDICPIRAATFGPDYRYNVSWCGPDGHVEYVPPNNDSSSGATLLPGIFALVIAALAVFFF